MLAASLPSNPTPDGPSPPNTPVLPPVLVPVPVPVPVPVGEFGVRDVPVPVPGVSEEPGVVGEVLLGVPLVPAALGVAG